MTESEDRGPVDLQSVRAWLAEALTAARYAEHVGKIDDPDLRDE